MADTIHEANIVFQCSTCGMNIVEDSIEHQHCDTHDGENWDCQYCFKECSSPDCVVCCNDRNVEMQMEHLTNFFRKKMDEEVKKQAERIAEEFVAGLTFEKE